MKASEIRQSFLDFFAEQQHQIVPSAPVFSNDDPTLMFTNAGMNQFKPYVLGQATPQNQRVADSQKCIRVSGKHNDLEEVGHDTYHHTMFEMLGNWSFGDYYKKEAITWAWELLTKRWNIPKNRLYATVFGGDAEKGLPADEEAEKLWAECTDIDPTHIKRFGAKDNFWMMGEVGPCGPCSEIHIDLTPDCSGGDLVNSDSPLAIELWNLVFMEFNAEPGGKLRKLPACHVDTGAGLDRIAALLECTNNCTDFTKPISNYDTSLFQPIIQELARMSGKTYVKGISNDEASIAMRVCSDHLRMVAFSIADGALPSNEGRGYVIRRILRRAIRYGRQLGLMQPFMYKLLPTLIEIMGQAYPELIREKDKIERIMRSEEVSFHKTIDRGISLFEEEAAKLSPHGTFPGEVAFRLYDTFGFPVDLTEVMAKEIGLSVDIEGFQACMQAQKERARAARVKVAELAEDKDLHLNPTKFVGYTVFETEATIEAVISLGKTRGVVLNVTPFYAEMGGQVGDSGELLCHGRSYKVTDTKKRENVFIHMLDASEDAAELMPGETVIACIDRKRRQQIACHHTATHLLHYALRQVLGNDVHQQGSLVAPDRLRFDFTFSEAVGTERLQQIEDIINAKIQENNGVSWFEIAYKDKPASVLSFFGDKYGDVVRVINTGGQQSGEVTEQPAYDGYSQELCGGTHVTRTGDLGFFRFLSEGAIAAGVRRVEAAVGQAAQEEIRREHTLLNEAVEKLHTNAGSLLNHIDTMLAQKKQLERSLEELKQSIAQAKSAGLLNSAKTIGDIPVIAETFPNSTSEDLRQMSLALGEKQFKGIAILAAPTSDKVSLLVLVSDDYVKQGWHAGKIIKAIAADLGGGGGGRPDMAQAGAKNAAKLPEVMDNIAAYLK
ncbi:alanine--tRNA ligase [bacterium]|nr:alanine--tRNA ligase [bacterium]